MHGKDVRLENVVMRFDDFTAVERSSLTINAGEFFSILGPSGCGKTTILRMISGFIEPTEGEVFIGSESMRGLGPARRPTALIFQNRILSRTESAATIMFYISVVATLGTLPVMLADKAPLLPEALGLLAFSGGLGTAGMFLTIKAYQVGEVSALAPFPYLRLVFSVVAGMLIFSETPGANTFAGAALIIVAAVVITRRSARR